MFSCWVEDHFLSVLEKREAKTSNAYRLRVLKKGMELNGKRALVTGGAVRIGRKIVELLQAAGAEVVVHYSRSEAEARALSPYVIDADLADPPAVSALMARVNQAYGPVDMLINNASAFTKDRLADATPERVLREFQINLFAPMELIRTFAAQTHEGAVINLLDRRIRCNDADCAPYSITKKGLEELTKLAAVEYAPRIRVNAVAPGPVLPPPGRAAVSVHDLAGRVPLEQLPTVQAVAEAALFLLGAGATTGQVVFVDGGQHLWGNGV